MTREGFLTRAELIDQLAAILEIFDSMPETLVAGDRIEIRGFGSFQNRDYYGYIGRNPKTGDETTVKPKKLPFFKVGKELKERIMDSGA